MPEKLAAKKATKATKPAAKKAHGDAAVLAKIAAMPAPYRGMGERVHALILRSAPALQVALWYGMPGCAKDGKTTCFFRADKKYMTFGFTQEANLTLEAGARAPAHSMRLVLHLVGPRDRGQALRHREQDCELRESTPTKRRTRGT